MSTNEPAPQDTFVRVVSTGVSVLFSYMGGIGRIAYWLGLLVVVMLMFGALAAFASAMAPTGASDSGLAIPLLVLALWIFSALMIKRLRHAGFGGWQYLLFIGGPAVLIAGGIEFLELLWPFILLGTLILIVVPGLYPGHTTQPTQSGDAGTGSP
jgi:uncharacterized membrane protein YhaH (DUF805 family)